MMQLQIPNHISGVAYYAAGVIAPVTLIWFLKLFDSPKLGKIPTFGSNTWLGSWWDSIRFVTNAADVIQEGHAKYKGDPFKISTFYGWLVVVSGHQHVEEFSKCRDDELHMMEALNDALQLTQTFEHDALYDPHHIAVLRSKLNRTLGEDSFADIKDEIVTGFDETLNLERHEWKSVPALSTVQQVVSRTSNRIFVGLPLCRDPDWVDLTIQVASNVVKTVAIISLLPKFMSPLVARFMKIMSGNSSRSLQYLAPIIEARQKQLDEHGPSWSDKPHDLLSGLMEESEGSRRAVRDVTARVLISNFAAIHPPSNVFTHALYILAANPQYAQALREEVESIIKEDEDWTKAALAKMHKVDSFMKETHRLYGPFITALFRKAMKDVTFSNGTVIPKGTYVVLATQSIHLEDKFYDNAATFDPFRFSNMRKEDSDDTKYHSATISPEYLEFGIGRHACPGRFFAATELDTMLAYLVVTYDIKLEENAICPKSLRVGPALGANPTARVMFRRRTA